MKTCSKCGEPKPLADYYKDKRSTDGLYSRCKACHQGTNAAARKKNWDAFLARQTARRDANRASVREWDRQWAQKNPEKAAAQRKRYRDRYPEKIVAANRAYYEANRAALLVKATEWRARTDRVRDPAEIHRTNTRRRARLLGAFVEDVERDALIVRDEGRCGICGKPIMDEHLEIDHIIPLSRGGTHEPANCQIAHRTCNRKKHARLDYEAA